MFTSNENNVWRLLSLLVVFWSPSIFLDYEYRYLSYSSEIILSPYIFFILNVISAGYLLSTLVNKSCFNFLFDRYFLLHFCMFTFGVFISVEHLQNFRLLIIWFLSFNCHCDSRNLYFQTVSTGPIKHCFCDDVAFFNSSTGRLHN